MVDRRSLLAGAMAALVAGCVRGGDKAIGKTGVMQLRAIEQRIGGRLGAYILDPATGRGFGWRETERFPHCSSFKLSLAAMMLAKGERGEIDLDEIVHWQPGDIVEHSPITDGHGGAGLSIRTLAHGTLVTSDNTAANVLLRRVGGPEELTRFWRSLGDKVSRLDRYEPHLNLTPGGTELDTTTPEAMAGTVARLLLDGPLSPQGRATLKSWMIETQTGLDRLRAGFPAGWIAGDKTGTGINAIRQTYVDLAFGGPAGGPMLIVAAYFEPARLVEPMDAAALSALADVGRVAARAIGQGDLLKP